MLFFVESWIKGLVQLSVWHNGKQFQADMTYGLNNVLASGFGDTLVSAIANLEDAMHVAGYHDPKLGFNVDTDNITIRKNQEEAWKAGG